MSRGARVALLAAATWLAGCATVPGQTTGASADGHVDPWEGFNRKVFVFNEAVDDAVLRPVAQVYRDVMPTPVRTGVGNFFGNLGDAWSAVNHFLQGKPQTGAPMLMRVATNTVFGIYGLIDLATPMGLTRHSEDFGQTLARWGADSGPYLVLPLLGPSTLRDTLALPLDRHAGSAERYHDAANPRALTPLQVVHTRAELLSSTRLAGQVSLDKYLFLRDAYLSRRQDQVFDGAPPLLPMDTGDEADAPPPASAAPRR